MTTILDSGSMELPVGGEVLFPIILILNITISQSGHSKGDTSSSCSGSSIEVERKNSRPGQVIQNILSDVNFFTFDPLRVKTE